MKMFLAIVLVALVAGSHASMVSYEGYVVGSFTNVLYAAAGGSDDWMMGVAEIPLAYTIELPGRNGGFQPAASEIAGIVKETFEGIKVYQKYVEQQWG